MARNAIGAKRAELGVPYLKTTFNGEPMMEEDATVERIKRALLLSISAHVALLTPPAPPVKKDSNYWRDVWLTSLVLVSGVIGIAALIVGVLFALELRT